MVTGKTFDELSDKELDYICTLKFDEVEEYLTRIHGRECAEGFAKMVTQNMDFLAKKYKVDFSSDEELA